MLRILVDTSADYTVDELKERNIEFVPLNITVEDTNYRDLIDVNRDDIYNMLINEGKFPKTSQPAPPDYIDIFEDVKEKGDSMVVITLSSALSGTYQTACLAKDMVECDDIYIVDSLSATHGVRQLVEYACTLRNNGEDAASIAQKLDEIKPKVMIVAAVDTLEYLCKGGRVSKAAAAVGELANIKPLITVPEDGSVHVPGKCMGRNKALATLVKNISAYEIDENFPIYSLYAYGEENTEKLEEKLEAVGIHISKRLQIGATIGVHVGPGAYGVVFISK